MPHKIRGKAARRAWLRAVEAGSSRSGCGPCRATAVRVPSDSEDKLLHEVLRRPLTLAEADARCHRTAKVTQLAIEEFERLTRLKVTNMTRENRLAKEQARIVRRLAGIPSSSPPDGSSTTNEDDHPPVVDACAEEFRRYGDAKGKCPTRKRWYPTSPPYQVCSLLSSFVLYKLCRTCLLNSFMSNLLCPVLCECYVYIDLHFIFHCKIFVYITMEFEV